MIVFSLLLGIVRNLSAFSAWRGVFESGVVVAQPRIHRLGGASCSLHTRLAAGVGRRASDSRLAGLWAAREVTGAREDERRAGGLASGGRWRRAAGGQAVCTGVCWVNPKATM